MSKNLRDIIAPYFLRRSKMDVIQRSTDGSAPQWVLFIVAVVESNNFSTKLRCESKWSCSSVPFIVDTIFRTTPCLCWKKCLKNFNLCFCSVLLIFTIWGWRCSRVVKLTAIRPQGPGFKPARAEIWKENFCFRCTPAVVKGSGEAN